LQRSVINGGLILKGREIARSGLEPFAGAD